MKSRHYHSRHISISFKPISDRSLDLEDDFDKAEAMKRLQAEFLALVEDVQYSMFGIINTKWVQEPKPVKPNALEDFKPKLHKLVPNLKNLTDEDLERLIDD